MDLFKQSSATREDLGLLAVMEALEDQEQVTQRELSSKTGLNLKKVNYCLHRLLEKGHVKFQRALNNPDKRAYLYILTPSGMKAKSRLTYGFLKFTLQFYSRVESKLRRSVRQMQEAGVEKLVLCGVSEAARIVLEQVEGSGIDVVGILDEDFQGTDFSGTPVLDESGMKRIECDGILITALDDFDELELRLGQMKLPESKIWRLS